MNNKDLLKQYVDIGQPINKYQYEKLTDNLKVTYLRKRMIAANQYENYEDYEIRVYEVLGAPKSHKPEMVNFLVKEMKSYFEDCHLSNGFKGNEMNYIYGNLNPVVKKVLESSVWDSRLDDIIIEFTNHKKFMKYMNLTTLNHIMDNVVNPSNVFSHMGKIGENFKKEKLENLAKSADNIVYSNNPQSVFEFLGKEVFMKYFKSLNSWVKANMLGEAKNPIALLPIIGDEGLDYIKQKIKDGESGIVSTLLNNSTNPYDLEKIFNKYGINYNNIDKQYE